MGIGKYIFLIDKTTQTKIMMKEIELLPIMNTSSEDSMDSKYNPIYRISSENINYTNKILNSEDNNYIVNNKTKFPKKDLTIEIGFNSSGSIKYVDPNNYISNDLELAYKSFDSSLID